MISEFLFNEALKWPVERVEEMRLDEIVTYANLAVDHFKEKRIQSGGR